MKKIAFSLLLLISSMLMSPIALATDLGDAGFEAAGDERITNPSYFCGEQDKQHTWYDTPTLGVSDEEDEQSLKQIDERIKTFTEGYKSGWTSSKTPCGEINTFSGSLEKGDCTKEVITELSEVIGPAIGGITQNNADGSTTLVDENRIIDVYKGICCMIAERKSVGDGESPDIYTCEEARTLYTLDLDSCQEKGLHCEHRQWVIGTSGAGIIKIYVKQLYTYAVGVIGFIVVVVFVTSGIQITMSGVSGDITSAKERITKAIMAMALLFLSGIILYTVNPTFFS